MRYHEILEGPLLQASTLLAEKVVDVSYTFRSNERPIEQSIKAHVDPSMRVLERLTLAAKKKSLRGIAGGGHIYVWDAHGGNHYNVAVALGFDPATFKGYGGPTSFWIVGEGGWHEPYLWAAPGLIAANGLRLTYETGKDTAEEPVFKRLLRQFKPIPQTDEANIEQTA